jgi:Mrp family chromosome partitioning ATPase
LASSGLGVVVVDAAFEGSMLHSELGTSDRPGFHDALRNETHLTDVAAPTRHPHLHLVPAGSGPQSMGTVIWARKALEELTDAFDVVVVHAPPLLDRAEASVLGQAVDGTVLVVEEARIAETDLDEALEQIAALPSPFLGVVVTRPARRRHAPFARRLALRA